MAVSLFTHLGRRTTLLALLVVATLLALLAREARATGQPTDVDELALARMMPAPELWPELGGFLVDPVSGYFDDASSRLENAYAVGYFDPDPFSGSGLYGVVFEAFLYTSASRASSSITDAMDDALGQVGEEIAPGVVLEEVTPFGVSGLGDEAQGVIYRFDAEGQTIAWTIIVFRIDRLIGDLSLLRLDTDDVRGRAGQIAQGLAERMKGVLTGEVTEIDAPLPPDVNCADGADSIDAALILQRDAGLIATLRCQFLADTNNDGLINSIDAAIVLQLTAGLIAWPLS